MKIVMPLFNPLRFALITVLLAATLLAQTGGSNIIVSYSFDDDNNATGPDTFRVFNFARGGVNLTSAYRYGGYRSVEFRDVAGDKAFPELQGYFPLRKKGKLFAHFALMTASAAEPFNIALAGPKWFTVQKDGIAFWLKSDDGFLHQHTDRIKKKLMPLRAFVWYSVDVGYDIDRGLYDLVIYEEGHNEAPLVKLLDQPNAPGEPLSAVDKFSFIGDLEDVSNAVYYVDDIIISTDRAISRKPLIAPGRRKLFVDTWNDYYKRMLARPGVIPTVEMSDFGIGPAELASLKQEGLLRTLGDLLNSGAVDLSLINNSGDNGRLVRAVALWVNGNALLGMRKNESALSHFQQAAEMAPEGKIFRLSAVLAMAALKRWEDVDAALARLYSDWESDVRLSVVLAMIGVARGNLADAERWLRDPAEKIAAQLENEDLRNLWSGHPDDASLGKLTRAHPQRWREYLESWLICEQYFFVQLWQNRPAEARQYAIRMSERYRRLGLSNWLWLERAGDAAFFLGDYPGAQAFYDESATMHDENTRVLLKLSDIHFLLGDVDKERIYRERIYGSLGR